MKNKKERQALAHAEQNLTNTNKYDGMLPAASCSHPVDFCSAANWVDEKDEDGETPKKNPVVILMDEIAAVHPSITNEKFSTIVLKSGYAFDVWKASMGTVVSGLDSMYEMKGNYLRYWTPEKAIPRKSR